MSNINAVRLAFIMVFLPLYAANAVQMADDNSVFEDLGPSVGEKIPHDLSALDQNGKPQSFETLKSEKGMVLMFFRSADWCPYCQGQLIQLQNIHDQFESAGVPLVGISYDPVETLQMFAQRRRVHYPLLSDPGSKIIEAFGITNDRYPEDHYAHGVPHPIILFLDANGIVKAKLYEHHYKHRPQSDAILEMLAQLAAD